MTGVNHYRTAATAQRRLALWVAGACLAVGCIAIARGVWGAERFSPGPHEIVLFAHGKDYDLAGRTQFVLSGPYDDRAACERAKQRVVVKVTGGKLVCHPVETSR